MVASDARPKLEIASRREHYDQPHDSLHSIAVSGSNPRFLSSARGTFSPTGSTMTGLPTIGVSWVVSVLRIARRIALLADVPETGFLGDFAIEMVISIVTKANARAGLQFLRRQSQIAVARIRGRATEL